MHSDLVNLRVAQHARARCLLVCDIDRGGAASRTCTAPGRCCRRPTRHRIDGFVLSRFPRRRGRCWRQGRNSCASLPPCVPVWRRCRCGATTVCPTDGPAGRAPGRRVRGARPAARAVVAWPASATWTSSSRCMPPGVRLLWARRRGAGCAPQDWIILPAPKHTSGDLQWLRQRMDRRGRACPRRAGAGHLRRAGGCWAKKSPGGPARHRRQCARLGLLPLVTVRGGTDRCSAPGALRSGAASAPGPGRRWPGLDDRGATRSVTGERRHTRVCGGRSGALPVPSSQGLAWTSPDGRVLGVQRARPVRESVRAASRCSATRRSTLTACSTAWRPHRGALRLAPGSVLGRAARPPRTGHSAMNQIPRLDPLPEVATWWRLALQAPQQPSTPNRDPALGRLESVLADRPGAGQHCAGTARSATGRSRVDHGLAARGVSLSVGRDLADGGELPGGGRGGEGVLARQHGLALTVVDCGVRHDFLAGRVRGRA